MASAARKKKPSLRKHTRYSTTRLLDWSNSIVFENHVLRCTYCGYLIVRNTWFRIRKDNGIVVSFCRPDHEKIYDQRFLHKGHEAYRRHDI